jgi:hypothetical protein
MAGRAGRLQKQRDIGTRRRVLFLGQDELLPDAAEHWSDDCEAVALLEFSSDSDFFPKFECAVDLLRAAWPFVEEVAEALLAAPGGFLTGKQVRAIGPY